jgi:hypothetical protein
VEVFDSRYCADLGGGFLIKWADAHTARAYGTLCDVVLRRSADAPLRTIYADTVAEWIDAHPLVGTHDIAVVVDHHDVVIAGAILLRQQMDYAGVQLAVGRPEMVVCHPDFRNRGFIREIFRLLHAKSHARGDVVQAITGIPFFYRQFGYAYAIDFDQQCVVRFDTLHTQTPSSPEVLIRRARADEYETFVRLYDADRLNRGLLCTTPFERRYFEHLCSRSSSLIVFDPLLITDVQDNPIGFLLVHRANYDTNICVLGAGVALGVSWQRILTPLMHALNGYRCNIAITNPAIHELSGVNFVLDSMHPVYAQVQHGYVFTTQESYAWYVRVTDYARLFTMLTPLLETRVQQSSLDGYTGTVSISCYGSGVVLEWQGGRLSAVRNTRPPIMGEGTDVCLPRDTFLMLLFGRKSWTDIRQWHHEAYASTDATPLIEILFPKQPSWFQWMN